jgi:membrane dipeptidase
MHACPVEGTAGTPGQGRSKSAVGSLRTFPGLDALSTEKRAEYEKRLDEIDAKYPPPPPANVKDLVD